MRQCFARRKIILWHLLCYVLNEGKITLFLPLPSRPNLNSDTNQPIGIFSLWLQSEVTKSKRTWEMLWKFSDFSLNSDSQPVFFAVPQIWSIRHNLHTNKHCNLEKNWKILNIFSNIDFMRHQQRSITPGFIHFYLKVIIPIEPSLARSPHHLI